MHASEGCMLRVRRFVDLHYLLSQTFPSGVYLFNNENTKITFEFFSKLTINTPQCRRSGTFIREL